MPCQRRQQRERERERERESAKRGGATRASLNDRRRKLDRQLHLDQSRNREGGGGRSLYLFSTRTSIVALCRTPPFDDRDGRRGRALEMRGKREKGREKEGGLLLPLFEQGEMGGGKTESGRERKRERRERAAKKRAAGVPDPDCERDETARAPPPRLPPLLNS